jgi:hypothetical protein
MKSALFFLVIFLLPFSTWAMTPLTDSELSDINGQAGVSIMPNIAMKIHFDILAWGDSDGLGSDNIWGGQTSGGYIGLTNFNMKFQIKPRDDNYNGYNSLMMNPITIDVATGYIPYGADTTFVRIGLGALKISMDQMQFNVALGQHADTTTGNTPVLKQVLGVASLGSMDVYVNPQSYIDVSPHASHGVTFNLNMILDSVNIAYVSWGGH